MSLWLERFGTVGLPLIEADQDIGAVGTRTLYMDLPGGGAYDAYGSEVAPRGMYTLQATGEIGNLTTQAEMQAQFDALRALRGRRDKLYARMDDGAVRWTYARLSNIPMRRNADNVLYLLAELAFDITSPIWYGNRHGAGWTFDSGEYFDSGLVFDEATDDVFPLSHSGTSTFIAGNAGNTSISNAVLTFTPGSAAITGFTMASDDPDSFPQTDLTYSGTIAVGQTLVLDMGAQAAYIPTVLSTGATAAATTLNVVSSAGFVVGRSIEIELLNGGLHRTTIATLPDAVSLTITDALPSAAGFGAVRMSAYPDLAFGTEQRIPEWFRIDPGGTPTAITITSSQDGSVTFSYSDGWE